ncbi:MAG: cation diffusion facilitator family transporter [Desulfobacca sp.]|uniref:cation diffusion facilitator family transporter n=1 Tax=Desulfobacca sp. TaxID=2067990 RepID=UPI00404A20F9
MMAAFTSPQRARLLAIGASVIISLLLLGIKFYAYWLTKSAAILSDALESIINVVASSFALAAVILAAKPPDLSHPYGHGKIEYVAVGFEGALIFLAAVGIFVKAGQQLWQPQPLPGLETGLGLLLGAGLVNLALGLTLIAVGRRTDSITLVADGRHILTDVYTSVGVLVGLALVWLTDLIWLDGATAALVGVNILYTGWKLLRQAFAGLLDESDISLLENIAAILKAHRKPSWIDIHKLRARKAGNRLFIDFHLILPRDFNLEEAHQEVKELEAIFRSHFQDQADVHIHIDPCDREQECPSCGYDPCHSRQADTAWQRVWRQDIVVAARKGEE